jgi:HEAT repeat protein
MTRDEAMEFLRSHQPLPEFLNEEQQRGLLETVEYLSEHPEPAALPLLLNIFGEGDAGGVYQTFDEVLGSYPQEDVVRQLAVALASDRRPVRYWAAQFAADFPDETLVEPLGTLAREGDFDMRYAAITALEQIASPAAAGILKNALRSERDPEIRALIEDALNSM